MNRTPPQFYTPAEVAEFLKVTRRTVYEYIHSGQLPATKVGPKHLRITEADLRAFLDLRRRLTALQVKQEQLRPKPVAFVQVAEQAVPPPLPFDPPEPYVPRPWQRPPGEQAAPPVSHKPEPQRPRKKGRR